jgi:hypothetical protein
VEEKLLEVEVVARPELAEMPVVVPALLTPEMVGMEFKTQYQEVRYGILVVAVVLV